MFLIKHNRSPLCMILKPLFQRFSVSFSGISVLVPELAINYKSINNLGLLKHFNLSVLFMWSSVTYKSTTLYPQCWNRKTSKNQVFSSFESTLISGKICSELHKLFVFIYPTLKKIPRYCYRNIVFKIIRHCPKPQGIYTNMVSAKYNFIILKHLKIYLPKGFG